jgi:hypothetical protein
MEPRLINIAHLYIIWDDLLYYESREIVTKHGVTPSYQALGICIVE